jgi:hypothetical protein
MIRGKKAFIERFAELFIGIVFTFLLFFLIIFFKGSIETAKTIEVLDVQYVDIASSYAALFSKLDNDTFLDLKAEAKSLDSNFFATVDIKKYAVLLEDFAYEEDLDTYEYLPVEHVVVMLIPKAGSLHFISLFTELLLPLNIPNKYYCSSWSKHEPCSNYLEVLAK